MTKSSFGDPERHAEMDALAEAEIAETDKKVQALARELHETLSAFARLHKLRPQHAVIAALEFAATSTVMAGLMSPDPNEAFARYVHYFEDVLNKMIEVANNTPAAQAISTLYRGKK